MAVTVYKSTDLSAPAVNGNAGSLITLLDAILVNGYGAKAAAGWTKAFAATNGATYQPGSGVQNFFHVDDNSPNVTAAGKEAQFRGSETASAFQTGTGFFPTAAQFALGTGLVIRKSSTADGTPRSWIVIADDRTVYIHIATADVAGVYMSAGFGEIYSLLAGGVDIYRSFVNGRAVASNVQVVSTSDTYSSLSVLGTGVLPVGQYMPRSYGAGGTAIQISKSVPLLSAAAGPNGVVTGAEPVTATVIQIPLLVQEPAALAIRGRMRGMFATLQTAATWGDGDTIVGAGAYTGRTFLIVKAVIGNNVGTNALAYDVTGAWETN